MGNYAGAVMQTLPADCRDDKNRKKSESRKHLKNTVAEDKHLKVGKEREKDRRRREDSPGSFFIFKKIGEEEERHKINMKMSKEAGKERRRSEKEGRRGTRRKKEDRKRKKEEKGDRREERVGGTNNQS